jgi:hypothetical protein
MSFFVRTRSRFRLFSIRSRSLIAIAFATTLATGCGSRKTVPAPERIGIVSLEASSSGLSRSSSAHFYRAPTPDELASRTCWTESVGNCRLWACEPLVYAERLDLTPLPPGQLTFSGLSAALDLVETTPGNYEAAPYAGAFFDPGALVSVEVEGSADFPAMTASLRGPSQLTPMTPSGTDDLILKADADLALIWSKTGASNVYVRLSVITSSETSEPIRTRALDCNFGASADSAVLPASLLKRLPKPERFESYWMDVLTSSFVEIAKEDAELWFQLDEFGISRPLRIEATP